MSEQTDPRRYLHIPKNFSDDDAEIRIGLPAHLDFSRDVVADRITQTRPGGGDVLLAPGGTHAVRTGCG
ncbi:hypothetical protein [Streptomyces rimosus]|uniref:hypothetical protein n=1 Tax=Streptomyces rimosus TaxID=1927 RepID=UPI0004C184BA|nr:hypothetical protein [Streptomyces rimosus]